MKKFILLALAFCFPLLLSAEDDSSADAYTEFISQEGLKKYEGDFMTIYHVDGSIYAEIPARHLGRDFLVGTTISSSHCGDRFPVGAQTVDPLSFRLAKIGSTIGFMPTADAVITDVQDPHIHRALERSYKPVAAHTFPICYYNSDSSAFVIDLYGFIDNTMCKGTVKEVSQISSAEDNVSFLVKGNNGESFLSDYAVDEFVTNDSEDKIYVSNVTFLLLPKEKMQPRFSGNYMRLNFMLAGTNKEFESSVKGFRDRYVVQRWRINPVDTAAWLRGEPTTVTKPIVFYIDDTFPEEFVEPTKRGVLRWNKAFERIGLYDVIQVREVPQGDSLFDLSNLKYSCIRYLPIPTANSLGATLVDSISGEILGATVFVFQGILEKDYKNHFIQTAQVDPRARGSQLSRELLEEAVEIIAAHEMGHALGLGHNYAASSAYPVDSLRSASFTRQYGISPSIMDYARYNYVAQPTDTAVTLTNPELGVFDYYAIEWLYKPHPEARDGKEESRLANLLLEQHEGDPLYRYSFSESIDPTCMIEDVGDDHLKASDYGMKNLKYILPHLSEWSGETGDYTLRKSLYDALLEQRELYIMHVMSMIGGLKVTDLSDPKRGQHFQPIPREQQRKALRWIFQQLRDSEWLDDPELADLFNLELKASSVIPDDYSLLFCFIPQHVALAAHKDRSGNPYTQREYFNDLYNELFRNTIAGRPLLDCERKMQRIALDELISVGSFSGYKHFPVDTQDVSDVDFSQIDEGPAYRVWMLQRIRSLMLQVRQTAPLADRAHYSLLLNRIESYLKSGQPHLMKQVSSDSVPNGFVQNLQ